MDLRRLLVSSLIAIATIAAFSHPLFAHPAKERCQDLVAFFDRWGTTRGEHTDGARNHTRIAANIDCERGHYAAGIQQMEALLEAKAFEVPVEVGEAPLYYPDEDLPAPVATSSEKQY
jgi:hypothetical protein